MAAILFGVDELTATLVGGTRLDPMWKQTAPQKIKSGHQNVNSFFLK